MNQDLQIIRVGDVLVDPEVFTVKFCCDLDACHGACCIEGESGAPVSIEEIAGIEDSLDTVWHDLSASAQAVIDKQGVAYVDAGHDLVTSIVGGKDCVFTCYEAGTCFCALEKAYRKGSTAFCKPISCALYPLREKRFSDHLVGLKYHRWAICNVALKHGEELNLPLYEFLKEPLIRRFGESWYSDLCTIADALKAKGRI